MSLEESDLGDMTEEQSRGPKPRKIRKLSWERSKLKNIKEILDECYSSGLNAKQRRTSARVSRCEEVSPRPCPGLLVALVGQFALALSEIMHSIDRV